MSLPSPASEFFGDLAIEALQAKKYAVAKRLTNIAWCCYSIEYFDWCPFDFPGNFDAGDWEFAARKLMLKGYDELPDHPDINRLYHPSKPSDASKGRKVEWTEPEESQNKIAESSQMKRMEFFFLVFPVIALFAMAVIAYIKILLEISG